MGPVGLILDSHTAPQIVRHRPSDWNTLDCSPQILHPHPPRPESLSVFPGLPTDTPIGVSPHSIAWPRH